jgi:uncharacterized protein
MKQAPLVVYHKNCADGMGAAWCFWRLFPNWEYKAAAYGNEPIDVFDRDIYLVDFSYKRGIIEDLLERGNHIRLLDHHAPVLETLRGLEHPHFDMSHSTNEHSGAMIAWKYTSTQDKHDKAPMVLRHIEDRDLWRFKLPHTKEIMAAVYEREMSFDSYNELMSISDHYYEALTREGAMILRIHDRIMDQIIRTTSRELTIQHTGPTGDVVQWNALFVNSPPMFSSEIGGKLAKDSPVVAIYYDNKDNRRFSLRSDNTSDVDVAKIAGLYGGGGHVHAAGFSVSRNHPLAKV